VVSKLIKVMRLTALVACFIIALAMPAWAEMQALDDESLSGVSGQSGITLDVEFNTEVAEVAYFEDGQGIALQGVRLSSALDPEEYIEMRLALDILDDGTLAIAYKSGNQGRFSIEDIRFVDTPGVTPLTSDVSLGGLFLDFELDGLTEINGNATEYVIDTVFTLSNGRFGYRTNGNELFLDDFTLDYSAPGATLDFNLATGQIEYTSANQETELSVEAIRLSTNPANRGRSTDIDSGSTLPSYGSFWSKMASDLSIQLSAGGQEGVEGLTVDVQSTIERLDLAYGDDTDWASSGYWLGALGGAGSVSIDGLTIDILADPDSAGDPSKDNGVGLALGLDQAQVNLRFQDVVLGETKANIDAYLINSALPVSSIGSVEANLLLADGLYNGVARTNQVYLQAGGNADAGPQGLRLDTQLSLVSTNNESNFVYVDDGNALMLSRLEAYADGDITIDITAAGVQGSTEFFDGLRLGFEDLDFGYQVEGYRLGQDTGDSDALKTKQLQAATAIPGVSGGLFGLAGFPSLEGRLNGQITLGPGGNVGDEGIAINADISLTDGVMAKYLDADGNGVWLSGLNYDRHLRDMFLDLTNDGLLIYETESWGRMDVTDLRIGNKVSGASFGRVVLETYEQGSETLIVAGGAGEVCIGGRGVDATACQADGGRWDDRGGQGVSFISTRFFKQSVEAENKRNRFTWETGRIGEGTASVQNGTGLSLVFDNFTTNDGDGLNDTFGIQTERNLDVANAYVVKEAAGADANGVVGNKGDVKVMNGDGSYRYVDPAALTSQDLNSLPLGIAVRTRTQFKEFDIDSVQLGHSSGQSDTLIYGLKFQNFDVTSDITTTVLD